ncbi:MAG: helix-turn-helix domain-containing protein [Bacteroidota bacterium]
MKLSNDSRLYTIEEIARLLNCRTWRIAKYVRKGTLKGYRQFGKFFIFEEDLVAFIKNTTESRN